MAEESGETEVHNHHHLESPTAQQHQQRSDEHATDSTSEGLETRKTSLQQQQQQQSQSHETMMQDKNINDDDESATNDENNNENGTNGPGNAGAGGNEGLSFSTNTAAAITGATLEPRLSDSMQVSVAKSLKLGIDTEAENNEARSPSRFTRLVKYLRAGEDNNNGSSSLKKSGSGNNLTSPSNKSSLTSNSSSSSASTSATGADGKAGAAAAHKNSTEEGSASPKLKSSMGRKISTNLLKSSSSRKSKTGDDDTSSVGESSAASTGMSSPSSRISKMLSRRSQANNAQPPTPSSIAKAQISGPSNVTHNAHVSFDPKSKKLIGIPQSLKPTAGAGAFVQFGCAIKSCPRVDVAGYKERIPAILVSLKEELVKNNGLLVEGIFRVAPAKEDQEQCKQQMDVGTYKHSGKPDSAICVAAVMKEWFRSMPIRLLNVLPRNITSNANDAQLGKSGDEIMRALIEPNNSVYCWMLDILVDTCANEAVNKMGVKQLSIVMAPNLYKCAEDQDMKNLVAETEGATALIAKTIQWRIEQRKGPKFVKLF